MVALSKRFDASILADGGGARCNVIASTVATSGAPEIIYGATFGMRGWSKPRQGIATIARQICGVNSDFLVEKQRKC